MMNSGCGLYHENYKDTFENLLQEESYEIAKNMVFDALSIKENEKEDLIISLFDKHDHEFHDYLVFPIQWRVSKELEKIMEIPFFKAIRTYHENH